MSDKIQNFIENYSIYYGKCEKIYKKYYLYLFSIKV